MDQDKQRQEVSLIGRILSIEALLFLMGCFSLYHGIVNDKPVSIFFGVIIIPGVFILSKVRKKDWKKHWEDMEAEHKVREAAYKKTKPPETPPEA